MSKPVVPAKGFSLPDVGHFGHYFIGHFPDMSKKSETDQQGEYAVLKISPEKSCLTTE